MIVGADWLLLVVRDSKLTMEYYTLIKYVGAINDSKCLTDTDVLSSGNLKSHNESIELSVLSSKFVYEVYIYINTKNINGSITSCFTLR